MRCECCIALRDDSGYEQDATEFWCAVGEEPIEKTDGSLGCKRKSVKKLKKDMERQNEIENTAFAAECESFVNWVEKNTIQNELKKYQKGDRVRILGDYPNYPNGVYATIVRKGHKNHWVIHIDGDTKNVEWNEKRLEIVKNEQSMR